MWKLADEVRWGGEYVQGSMKSVLCLRGRRRQRAGRARETQGRADAPCTALWGLAVHARTCCGLDSLYHRVRDHWTHWTVRVEV